MTRQRPPADSSPRAAGSPAASSSDSALTAIRIAWKTRVAGWPRRRPAAGTAASTTAASSAVVATGRAETIARAIRRA